MPAYPRGVARIPAALLALFWIVAPVAGAVHALESQHRYCLEHGTFEESDAAAHGEQSRTESDQVTRGESRDDAAHAECPFSHLCRADASLTAHRDCSVVACAVHADAIALESIDVRPIELLAAAPKNSPPAAA